MRTNSRRIEHMWSSTNDEYRGYADWRFRAIARQTEIAAKLPVHLRHRPDVIAA